MATGSDNPPDPGERDPRPGGVNDLNAIGDEIREAITQLVVPLQTTKAVNEKAFRRLERSAELLASTLKGSELLPRSLLKELYVTARMIRAEAPYVKGEAANLGKMADRIQMIFDLILFGESCDDRKPGVPRVI